MRTTPASCRRVSLAAVLFVLATVSYARVASPCDCLIELPDLVLPSPGATGIPTNGAVVIGYLAMQGVLATLEPGTDAENVVPIFVPDSGEQISAVRDDFGIPTLVYAYRPVSPLQTGMGYRVVVEGVELTHFSVGDAEDDDPPPAPTVESWSARHGGSYLCAGYLLAGHAAADFQVVAEGAALFAMEMIAIDQDGVEYVHEGTLSTDGAFHDPGGACGRMPRTIYEYEKIVFVAYDAALNASEPSQPIYIRGFSARPCSCVVPSEGISVPGITALALVAIFGRRRKSSAALAAASVPR